MPLRQPRDLPRLWLMTDERLGAGLLAAIAALPRGSGVIFRHYSLAGAERRALFDAVAVISRRRRHILVLAGCAQQAQRWGADGAHGRTPKRHHRLQTVPVHSQRERVAAERAGANLIFVSPIFPTPSHPGARTLGRAGFGLLTRDARARVIAVGGMTRHRSRALSGFGIYGWAAISAFARPL